MEYEHLHQEYIKSDHLVQSLRIHHECEVGIEKSVPRDHHLSSLYCEGGVENFVSRITFWHHQACQVMIGSDPEGQIFLSHPLTNYVLFFLLTIDFKF